MQRTINITDYGKDYGYCRFNAYTGGELLVSTNDPGELSDAIRELLTDIEPEPDEPMPGAREMALMERGVEVREVKI